MYVAHPATYSSKLILCESNTLIKKLEMALSVRRYAHMTIGEG